MKTFIKQALLGLLCTVIFAPTAIAQAPDDITTCMKKLIAAPAGKALSFYKLGKIDSIEKLKAICPIVLGKKITAIDALLNEYVQDRDKFSLGKRKTLSELIQASNAEFLAWATTLENKSVNELTINEVPKYDVSYFEKLTVPLSEMNFKNISENDYGGYFNTQVLNFSYHRSTFELKTTQYETRPDFLNQCTDNVCKIYLETYLFQILWDDYWTINSIQGIKTLHENTISAIKKYDHFLLKSGDGLYPWEILINSKMFSKDDITYVPNIKWNVLHPTPIIFYSDKQSELEPSVLVEVIGATFLNYSTSKNGSLPIGGSFAVDLQSNQVRYGGVVHLPIKNAFKHVKLGMIADIIPCEVCSIAVMTDGHNDWSVGFKINAAGLLYAPDKAKAKLMSYLK